MDEATTRALERQRVYTMTFYPIQGPDLKIPKTSLVIVRFSMDTTPSNETLPERLHTASPAKKVEFMAGRFCATRALRACHAPSDQVGWLGKEPVWPSGFVGSITHTGNHAAAVVASRAHLQAIGLDAEHLYRGKNLTQSQQKVLDAQEQVLIHAKNLDPAFGFSLFFSAKESLFKCLFPLVRTSFGFSAAQITELDVDEHSFQICLLKDLDPFPMNSKFSGTYDFHLGIIFTCIAVNHLGTETDSA